MAVKLNCGTTKDFPVKVGVHQGSVLSLLLFIIVMEALSRQFRTGLPWELLYADDLVLLAKTREELKIMLERWRSEMESKGLRVNVGKTKVMRCQAGTGQVEESGEYPCGVCRKGVDSNSIRCSGCSKWIHKKCSGVSGKLQDVDVSAYVCPSYMREEVSIAKEDPVCRLSDTDNVELVDKFCYLGDMVGKGGGAEDASRARERCAWGSFNDLLRILANRGSW